MNKPHKHAELIKAWADGAEIEEQHNNEIWRPFDDGHWMEADAWKYRIKPEPKPDVVMYGYADTKGIWRVSIYRGDGDNIKATFDGDTGKLKTAEVLK
jgi:hypothetical protein